MRSVRFRVSQSEGFNSINRRVAQEAGITREAVHQFNILTDGTAVVLCQISGDFDRARELVGDHPEVLRSTITDGHNGEALWYMHVRPPESIADLVRIPRTHEVFYEYPLTGLRENEIRVTMIGETDEMLQRALADVPGSFAVVIERIGPYPEDVESIPSMLTERQQEILDIATDLGYYQVPRQATHRDIAERVELDPGTVSEHMQRIEARVFEAISSSPEPGG